MTLVGLLKHMAYVEDAWFTRCVAEAPQVEPWANVDWSADEDWDWHSAVEESGDHVCALWRACVDRSRAVVAGQLDQRGDAALDDTHPAWGGKAQVSLRWVLVHMIEEYARHNGHADLLRESIDGEMGE
jgi:uncharacterized damage-inducible protein DinB